jgi:hypothetical protein
MQLDNTRIAVRERGMIDTLDLTLHVLRSFAPRLIHALLLGIVPLAVLNHILVSWMSQQSHQLDWGPTVRYLWNYSLLVFFQAPLATIFAEAYLGAAVFKQEKSLKAVVRDVASMFGSLLVCQLLMRGTLIATLLPLAVYRDDFNPYTEVMILPLMALLVAGLRAFRPYINEIIVLERNPLWSRHPGAMTVGKRSSFLHGPSSGDLFAQWLGTLLVVGFLGWVIYQSLFLIYAIMFSDMNPIGWASLHILFPATLWCVAAFMGVFRFLSYLDLRIRQEGWEVELLIKAEAARLSEKLA